MDDCPIYQKLRLRYRDHQRQRLDDRHHLDDPVRHRLLRLVLLMVRHLGVDHQNRHDQDDRHLGADRQSHLGANRLRQPDHPGADHQRQPEEDHQRQPDVDHQVARHYRQY
jgi:hypothetical protein